MNRAETVKRDAREGAPWMCDERLMPVLRASRIFLFEYDLRKGTARYSPLLPEMLAGNYDGRALSAVMLEDGVVHSKDVGAATALRDQVRSGLPSEVTLRLMDKTGGYRWFRLQTVLCGSTHPNLIVGCLQDVDEDMRRRELLRYNAEFDPVCGVFNKASFYRATQETLKKEPNRLRYLLRFDIDRFKVINELYSAVEGDNLLWHVGQVLREMTTPDETYARMGNDVFCACLARTERQVLQFTEQLEERINDYPLAHRVMISVGIVRLRHYEGQPISLLCDWAALAQQTIKGNYIRRCAFYERVMSTQLNQEHFISGRMHSALENGEFFICLQPKYSLAEKKVVGAETLVRWKPPDSAVLLPGSFIPLFEKNGFVVKLDRFVWEQTCRLLRQWLDEGKQPPPVSVNVSRLHLYDPDFCDNMVALVQKYNLPPSLLELEITESAYAEHPQMLYDIIDTLQQKGFVFLMDDFGSGYSSLNALKDIPVDIIKIDLHFLRKARRGEQAGATILRGAIRLVRDMGLPVVAEGVETEQQAAQLQQMGCDCAQGYYFAPPLPVNQFEAVCFGT